MSAGELSVGDPDGPAVIGPAVIGPEGMGPAPLRGAGTWSLTWHGVRTVATLELRQRVKSTRWIITLVIWGAILGGLTALIRWAVFDLADPNDHSAGPTMFGVIIFLVLSLGTLVSPALSATSVNGDRTAGVLAIMQSTLLSPAELALGKLLAAWTSALALLAVALPFIGWAYVEGGTPIARLVVVLIVLALTLLVVCAIGLGCSALTARTSTSAVLTYLTVTFLSLGLPLLFALSLVLVQSRDMVPVRQPVDIGGVDSTTGNSTQQCQASTEWETRTHTERTWWLLAPSPYVIVSDAAPTPSRHLDDPLTAIRTGVREARLGPSPTEDWCDDATSGARARQDQKARENLPAAWPYGLGVDLLVGAGFVVLTVRRLRTPADRLPRGTRVA